MGAIGCDVCGSPALQVRLHHEDGLTERFCEEHAPIRLAPDDDLPDLTARHTAGARDADTLYDLACALLRAGDAASARALLEDLLEREPRRLLALERLADCLERMGDVAGALAVETRALEAAPDDGEVHARLGRLHAQRGDLDAALGAFERGAEVDPLHLPCLRRAAVLRIARGEAERAAARCERYLERTVPEKEAAPATDPSRPQTTARDLASRLAFDERERRLRFRRDYELAAGRSLAQRLLGHALRSLGQEDEARVAYDAAEREADAIPEVLRVEVARWLADAPGREGS